MPPSFVTGCRTLCSAAEYLQHLQDQRDAAKKAHGEKFWPTFTFGTTLAARSRWTVNRPSVEGPPWLAQRALAWQSKQKAAPQTVRGSALPLFCPLLLGMQTFLGERMWRLQIQFIFFYVPACLPPFSCCWFFILQHWAVCGESICFLWLLEQV